MVGMTIEELQESRAKLESDMNRLITAFERENSGATVTEIVMYQDAPWGGTGPQTVSLDDLLAQEEKDSISRCSIKLQL